MGKFEVQTLKMNFRFMVLILTKTNRGLGVFPQPSSRNRKKGWVPPTSTHHRPQATSRVPREKKIRVGPAHMLLSVRDTLSVDLGSRIL